MNESQRRRLLEETRETADRLNKLNTFMSTSIFPTLEREDKDLLYEQQRVMSKYLQILGKRLERAGSNFTHIIKLDLKLEEYVGAQLAELRKEKGLNLREAADLVGLPHANQIRQVEVGLHSSQLDTLEKICKGYGVSLKSVLPND